MARDIKDYLHLYLGCECEYGFEGRKYRGEIIGHDYRWGWQISNSNPFAPFRFCKSELIKLILRPLSSMTEEEAKEMVEFDRCSKQYSSVHFEFNPGKRIDLSFDVDMGDEGVHTQTWGVDFHLFTPKDVFFLLSKGFDLFNLIPENLAIEKI